MTELQKMELETNIARIETKIDSYIRTAERCSRQAFYDNECGYRESARFNKGQEFTLQYVIEDLQIILKNLKAIQDLNENKP